jgi:hypothetical protein
LRNNLLGVGLSVCALAFGLVAAQATQKHHRARHHHYVRVLHRHSVVRRGKFIVVSHVAESGAENELLGIHLYDSMLRVLDLFGSPDQIQPLNIGGTAQSGQGFGGGGGGFGGIGRGAPSGPGGGGAVPGSGDRGGPRGGASDIDDPFGFGNDPADFIPPGGAPGGGGAGRFGGGPPNMGGGGPGGMPRGGPGGGPPGMGRGGPGGGAGAPTGGGGTAASATYTRWVYNRNDNKYGFVIDKNGRVIEIEAIGITNPKVETRRGVSFGTGFAAIIRKYHDPDGYDIAGDNITLRYLVHDKVAFKLTRLGEKKPHQVTGIVVAAGKP